MAKVMVWLLIYRIRNILNKQYPVNCMKNRPYDIPYNDYADGQHGNYFMQ